MLVNPRERYQRNKGFEEGKSVGETKGFNEAKIEVARKMLAEKFSVEKIASLTGLSEEDIKNLE